MGMMHKVKTALHRYVLRKEYDINNNLSKQHSTLNTQHSTLNTQHSTLNTNSVLCNGRR